MAYIIKIKDMTTGEVRDHEESGEWDDGAEYMWTEGNYSCDCNRGMFFAAGREEDPCGDTRYTITTPDDA